MAAIPQNPNVDVYVKAMRTCPIARRVFLRSPLRDRPRAMAGRLLRSTHHQDRQLGTETGDTNVKWVTTPRTFPSIPSLPPPVLVRLWAPTESLPAIHTRRLLPPSLTIQYPVHHCPHSPAPQQFLLPRRPFHRPPHPLQALFHRMRPPSHIHNNPVTSH